MRPINNSIYYNPGVVPEKLEEIQKYLQEEAKKLSIIVEALSLGHLDMIYVAPSKPRTGDIRLADGTSWNPGLGAGVYCYYSSTWNKLG